MKIRLTIGNIFGVVATAAGAIAAHEQIINLVTNTVGGPIAAVGVLVIAVSKAILSTNTKKIPEAVKSEAGPVVFEKTAMLK